MKWPKTSASKAVSARRLGLGQRYAPNDLDDELLAKQIIGKLPIIKRLYSKNPVFFQLNSDIEAYLFASSLGLSNDKRDVLELFISFSTNLDLGLEISLRDTPKPQTAQKPENHGTFVEPYLRNSLSKKSNRRWQAEALLALDSVQPSLREIVNFEPHRFEIYDRALLVHFDDLLPLGSAERLVVATVELAEAIVSAKISGRIDAMNPRR